MLVAPLGALVCPLASDPYYILQAGKGLLSFGQDPALMFLYNVGRALRVLGHWHHKHPT